MSDLGPVTLEACPREGIVEHEYAKLFPVLDIVAQRRLVDDIRERGVIEPVVFLGRAILDGRHRYYAAREIGIAYPRADYLGSDPLGFVVARNLHRRHLTDRQRADIAARIATLPRGANQHPPSGGPSVAAAAALMEVPVRAVERSKVIQQQAAPALKAAYDAGDVWQSTAADVARLPESEQAEIVARGRDEILAAAKRLRGERQAEKKAMRETREAELGARQRALPAKRYGVIYADPPWSFAPYSRETGMDRAADNHYPTLPLDEIKALPVGSIAAEDCALFLWATAPMLPQALEVMAAWGFAYKSHAVWMKRQLGTGYWFRNMHELLLVGTRGEVPAPAMGSQWASILDEPAGAHSEKPERFAALIEHYFPTLPKIELHARRGRLGWDLWGNEAPPDEVVA